jgi:dethiobiotin synthetase
VLGTGTGVGKTVLSVELAKRLQAKDRPVLALKPIETGFPPSADRRPMPGSDAAQLEAATFHVEHPRPHPLHAFRLGISPHLAAERSGQFIELAAVLEWVAAAEQGATTAKRPLTLVETAGGAFSPLNPKATNCDLALALKGDLWLLVAPDRLGVLHDVAATLGAMAQRGRLPDLVFVAPAPGPDASTGSNAEELRRLHAPIPVMGHGLSSDPVSDLLVWLEARLSS